MANIREQCSWVHPKEPQKATEKAKEIVKMAVAKASLLEPQEEPEIDVQPTGLVIGGGISGMAAAVSLANQKFKVRLVEKEDALGGRLRELYKLYPNDCYASDVLDEFVQAVHSNPNITVHTSSTVKQTEGFIGNFKVTIDAKGKEEPLDIGTIIVATGADVLKPNGMFCYGQNKNVVTQLELEKLMKEKSLETHERRHDSMRGRPRKQRKRKKLLLKDMLRHGS